MPKKRPLSEAQIKELEEVIQEQRGTAKEFARVQAILLHERGFEAVFIGAAVGLQRSAVFKWRARYQHIGLIGLEERKSKPEALLTKKQKEATIEMLKTKTPKEYGYKTEYWTTKILGEIIKRDHNVEYKSRKPLYLLFEDAKFTYHKPGQQYHNRNQEQVDAWKKKITPVAEHYLKDPDTVVLSGDEMILSTQTTTQKVWLPVNTYPKIDVSNKRENRSIYGFLNIKSGVQHSFPALVQNSEVTISMLEKLCAFYPDKKIVLFWDNASWHRSKQVRDWLSSKNNNRIQLQAYPPYTPDVNPQEHVWKAVRSAVSHNKFIENIDAATSEFIAYLNQSIFRYNFLGLIHV